jgi:hypothetical protein
MGSPEGVFESLQGTSCAITCILAIHSPNNIITRMLIPEDAAEVRGHCHGIDVAEAGATNSGLESPTTVVRAVTYTA